MKISQKSKSRKWLCYLERRLFNERTAYNPAAVKKAEQGGKLTMLTAYDYPTAQLVDEAGIDMILVGDSLGMVVLGYEDTLPVTMDDMVRHTQAVVRGAKKPL